MHLQFVFQVYIYLDISTMKNTPTLTVRYTLAPIKHIPIMALAAF